MKTVGRSIATDGTPYVHLGYLVSNTFHPQWSLLGGGIGMLAIGLVLARLGMGKKAAATRARWLLVAALCGIGILAMVLSAQFGRRLYHRPESTTRSFADQILHRLDQRLEKGRPLPADMAGVAQAFPELKVTDAWSREMRLTHEAVDGVAVCFVMSAGPDGQFGTGDDLRFPTARDLEMKLLLARAATTQPRTHDRQTTTAPRTILEVSR